MVCDLDGVVYLGNKPVQGAGAALVEISDAGHQLIFCTNNSSRTKQQAADKIAIVTGYPAVPSQIASSAMAAARVIGRGRVMAVGGEGVVEAIAEAGAELIHVGPVDAVVVGIDFGFDYATLHRASTAIRNGARFIATNGDTTYPTSDGLMPGAGSIVAAVEAASGVSPVVAGKPEETMRTLLTDAAIHDTIVVVGDRFETDLEMAQIEGWVSVLVETGVTAPGTVLDPPPTYTIPSITYLPALIFGL